MTVAWKKGPLPPETYGYGGIVPLGAALDGSFLFADFCGDTVTAYACAQKRPDRQIYSALQVAWYDNSLTVPPTEEEATHD